MTRIRYYAAASVMVPAAAVLVWPAHRWLLAVFLVWTAACFYAWNRSLQRDQTRQLVELEHRLQQAAITTLNHHRHDWMNELQIVYGYVRMGKTDKTIQCVEQIRERMLTESKIAKLGIPSLVVFLQSFRTREKSLVIDMDIDGEVNLAELPIDNVQTAKSIIALIEAYCEAAAAGTGEAARLMMDISADEESLQVSFHFDGELVKGKDWKLNCELALQGSPLELTEADVGRGMLMLEAQLGK